MHKDYNAFNPEDPSGLIKELASLLNKHSAESVSGTPDFVLANFMIGCLQNFNEAVHKRAEFREEVVEFKPLADWQTNHEHNPESHFDGREPWCWVCTFTSDWRIPENIFSETDISHAHMPVQHRDGKPPWCKYCGLTAEYHAPVSKFNKGETK